MIKVVKPGTVPGVLAKKGTTINSGNLKLFRKNANAILDLDNKVYGHKDVKVVLKNLQHSKCCFCEKDQSDENGAVEHFRPKDGYKIKGDKTMRKPGYFWLCYDWNNLFFVCSVCNSAGNKGNFFPLSDETKRANAPDKDISLEESLLLDPAGSKDPRNHINFSNQFAVGKTKFGRQTIKICGLNRDVLKEKRLSLIAKLDLAIAILSEKSNFSSKIVAEARACLLKSQRPESEFSATAIDYLSQFTFI